MVSIIIPVFNNAHTIEKTLRSIRAQSYNDFEVIVINDGSKDESEEVIRNFIEGDSRFTLISQTNKGVSAARNEGLEAATGEYVLFVDGDDLLPENALQVMHQIALTNDADTIIGMYEREDGTVTKVNTRSRHLANSSLRVHADNYDIIHTWTLCNKWLSRSIIEKNKLRFDDSRHLEDGVFLYHYLKYAEKIYTCPYIVYTYIKPLPIMGRTTTQRINSALLKNADSAFRKICDLTEDYGPDFRNELTYRYIITPLLGDYYRRIWKLEDDAAEKLAEMINEYFSSLDPERQERLLGRNKDIFDAEHRVKTLAELLSSPTIAVVVTGKVSEEYVSDIIEGLLDQAEVSIRILVDKCWRERLEEQYGKYSNLKWIESSSENIIREELSKSGARYAAVIDQNMLYNHATLRAMAKALDEEEADDFARISYLHYDGKEITQSVLSEFQSINAAKLADMILANKLFRNDDSILRIALSPEAADGKKNLAAELNYIALKSPEMLSLSEDMEIILSSGLSSKTRTTALGRYGQYLNRNNVTLGRKALSFIKRLLKGSKKDTKEKKPPEKKTKKKQSAAAKFYLNCEIDKNLVVIEGLGKRPKGSSLYILRELMKPEYSDLRIVFPVLEKTEEITKKILEKENASNVTTVLAGSKEYKKALFSAAYLFNEVDFPNWWIKKPGQVYANIWHGTPLKKLGKQKSGYIHHDANAARNFTMADYVLFANQYSIEHIVGDSDVGKLTPAKGLMIGYPRTGELFDTAKRDEVRAACNMGKRIVSIWMPTWNDSATSEGTNAFLHKMDALFSDDEVMYVNLHHKSKVTVDYSELSHIRPFPADYDIYEFLTASDVLITDYSSIFFDYAACGKKIILHCPDVTDYAESRGLYFDIQTLPFPITQTEEALYSEIIKPKNYDDSEFLRTFNAYDSSRNAELLCRRVILDEEGLIEEYTFEKEENAVFIVADSFRTGKGTELLYELYDSGRWGSNVYLSFQEKVADADVENIYPLVRNVNIFATKGKPLTERAERNRLYNTLDIRKFILLDPSDASRIRIFSCFPETVDMILTERQTELIESGDKEMRKAVKNFVKYGNKIFAISEEVKASLYKEDIDAELLNNVDDLCSLIR